MLGIERERAQGMAALAHVILDNRTDVVDNDIPLIRDVGGRENRGPARDDRHDGLVVVARREVEIGNLRGKHQLPELVIQCD